MQVNFLRAGDPGREAAKDHIRRVYKNVYNAEVTSFAPLLITTTNEDGMILCAAGLRVQEDGFFSGVYLDDTIPERLSKVSGTQVAPSEVLEVVSLASTTPFPVLAMLDEMLAFGRAEGKTWGVFTATRPLLRLLKRSGLPYMDLCAADPSCIDNLQSWGNYYDTAPRVCAFSDEMAGALAMSPRNRRQMVHSAPAMAAAL